MHEHSFNKYVVPTLYQVPNTNTIKQLKESYLTEKYHEESIHVSRRKTENIKRD